MPHVIFGVPMRDRRSQELMEVMGVSSDGNVYALQEFLQPPVGTAARQVVQSSLFMRNEWEGSGRAALILDQFSDARGASGCFVRLQRGPARIVRFVVDGAHPLASCPSGGWLIKPAGDAGFWYWVPQSPVLRTIDSRERILSERAAKVVGVRASSTETTIEIEVPNDSH